MKKRIIQSFALLLVLILTACSNNDTRTNGNSQQEGNSSGAKSGKYAKIGSGSNLVKFPDLEEGIVFTTYDYGDIHEDIYVNNKEAIEAAQNGEEFPSGTVLTLVGYKDRELYQYLVMEKRIGWGSQYSPKERNGEWEYQHFAPDGKVAKDNLGRCFSCHANQERDDYMNSMDEMKEFDLGEVAQLKNSSTETTIAAIPTDHWNVSEISVHLNEPKDINKEESNVLDGEEKAKIMQDVLLKMYLKQFES